jgi:hypothetical protein
MMAGVRRPPQLVRSKMIKADPARAIGMRPIPVPSRDVP